MEKELVTGEGYLKPLNLIDRQSVWARIKKRINGSGGRLPLDGRQLGLILDKLDELGIANNTIVVFVSDHGSERKGSLIKNRGTEIPCLIRWPKVIKPAPSAVDFFKTRILFLPGLSWPKLKLR